MSRIGGDLVKSMGEALAHARGDTKAVRVTKVSDRALDVKAIRAKTGLSQDKFAMMIGVSASTIRKWEQDERRPTGAAQSLLRVIEREPAAVRRALAG
jgi:putative transcriptional regulator